MTTRPLPWLAVLMAACSSDPMSGTWDLTFSTVDDQCGTETSVPEDDTFTLDFEAKTITNADRTSPCTYADPELTCTSEFEEPLDGIDAALVFDSTEVYRFDGREAASLTATLELTCEGADCGLLEDDFTFPCDIVFTGSATFAE